MRVSTSTVLLVVAIVGTGAFALTRDPPAPEHLHVVAAPPDPTEPEDPEDPDLQTDPMAAAQDLAPDDEAPSIEWSAPAGWRTLPSPSNMRIATYLVPRAAGDESDAEVSVSRAGGDLSSNIRRWAEQFEDAGEPKQQRRTVHGIPITVVELEGAYTPAMHPEARPHPGWALLAAIVEGRGEPYFFKMTGPAATVHAARAAFATMLESIRSTD